MLNLKDLHQSIPVTCYVGLIGLFLLQWFACRSCYSKAPRSCYTRGSRAAATAAAASADHASPPVSPHAATTPQHRSNWGFHILSSRHAKQQQHTAGARTGMQADAQDSPADQEGSALLGGSSPSQQHASPFHWLRTMGRRGSRPGYAAAASSDSGSFSRRNSEASTLGGAAPSNSEAALVEHALQACLAAADTGQLDPSGRQGIALQPAAGSVSGATGIAGMGQTVPPAGAFSASSSGAAAAGRGAALANSFVKAASKVVLRTKRPAAPGKKDDDESQQPPLQQSKFDSSRQPHALSTAAPSASGAGPQLPVSTGATAGSVHSGTAAAAVGAGGAVSMEGVEAGSNSTGDLAAAASSAGKPLPTSLRSRKGWAWGGVLGTGPGDQGWVNDDSSRRSSLAGRRVVEYLGQTVGHTGRLMVETTGQLLKSSNVLFQACTAPVNYPAAAGAAAAAAAVNGHDTAAQATTASGSMDSIVVAPSSTGMERDGVADGPFVAALAANLAEEEEGSTDSDSDPDLQGLEGEEDDSAFGLLDQPALRGNISALVAAVSSDAASAGQALARVHEEEDRAAEKLLQDMGASSSEPNIQRLALQHQQQQQQRSCAAAPGSSGRQQQQWGRGGRVSPTPDSLRRESPMFPAASGRHSPTHAKDGSAQAAGSGDGSGSKDKAAERLARRRMYPAGRVLHLMPKSACPQGVLSGTAAGSDAATGSVDAAAADGDGGNGSAQDSCTGSQQQARRFPPLTAAHGSVGLGDDYVLLEVPDAGVYGRVKLCPAMVRDHFIPSYLKALDSVMVQLQQVAGASASGQAGLQRAQQQAHRQGVQQQSGASSDERVDGRGSSRLAGTATQGRWSSAGEVLVL